MAESIAGRSAERRDIRASRAPVASRVPAPLCGVAASTRTRAFHWYNCISVVDQRVFDGWKYELEFAEWTVRSMYYRTDRKGVCFFFVARDPFCSLRSRFRQRVSQYVFIFLEFAGGIAGFSRKSFNFLLIPMFLQLKSLYAKYEQLYFTRTASLTNDHSVLPFMETK